MNLVAKEYVAAQNPDDPGVLVLSRFAGAAWMKRISSGRPSRERLNRMTYDCAAAVSAVISLDTGLPPEEAMLLGVGLIGSVQVTARHWLDRDSKLSRATATDLLTNILWRGISGFPRTDER